MKPCLKTKIKPKTKIHQKTKTSDHQWLECDPLQSEPWAHPQTTIYTLYILCIFGVFKYLVNSFPFSHSLFFFFLASNSQRPTRFCFPRAGTEDVLTSPGCFLFFSRQSHTVVQAGLTLEAVLLPLPHECWDYRHELPQSAHECYTQALP